MTAKPQNPIDLALVRFPSQSALAKALKVSRQRVNVWRKTGVPVSRVNEFSEITKVPRWIVDPIHYPPEKEADVAEASTGNPEQDRE